MLIICEAFEDNLLPKGEFGNVLKKDFDVTLKGKH